MPRHAHIDNPRAFAQRLRETRLRAGLSQRTLAFDGCGNAYLSRIEAGDRVPSLQVIDQLARRLGIATEWLAKGDASPQLPTELTPALRRRVEAVETTRTRYEKARQAYENAVAELVAALPGAERR